MSTSTRSDHGGRSVPAFRLGDDKTFNTRSVVLICLAAACFVCLNGLLAASGRSLHLAKSRDNVESIPRSHDIVRIVTPKSNPAFQPSIDTRSSKRLFQGMPVESKKTFYAHSGKMCHGMIRALRELGWTRVNRRKDAQLIWTFVRKTSWYPTLEPWQRYNHVPRTYVWNHKDKFAKGLRKYQENTGFNVYFVPITYDLNVVEQVEEFKTRLLEQGGLDQPWVLKEPNVNQGKGITMLAPNSPELEKSYKKGEEGDYIIQQYICDEMTWNGRKFDVRMYWFVASTDPLIVFYIDGYARVGNSKYKENDFNNTRDHLTTHTFLGEEGKGSFDEFAERLVRHHASSAALQEHIQDPVKHVKGQFKEAISRIVDAFKGQTFQTGDPLSSEDSFELYGADFILDNDLDVWLIEPQDDTGMDQDHYFRLEMHHNIYHGMATILEEIWEKQEKGLPILPIQNNGLWEVIYADGWVFEYEGYKRSNIKKNCG